MLWCKREKLKRNLVRAPKCGISVFKNAKCDEWKRTCKQTCQAITLHARQEARRWRESSTQQAREHAVRVHPGTNPSTYRPAKVRRRVASQLRLRCVGRAAPTYITVLIHIIDIFIGIYMMVRAPTCKRIQMAVPLLEYTDTHSSNNFHILKCHRTLSFCMQLRLAHDMPSN